MAKIVDMARRYLPVCPFCIETPSLPMEKLIGSVVFPRTFTWV